VVCNGSEKRNERTHRRSARTLRTNPPRITKTRRTNPPWFCKNTTNEPTAAAVRPTKMRRTNPNSRAARPLCGTRRNEAIFAIRSPELVLCQRDRAMGDSCETKPIVKLGDRIMDAGRRQTAPNEPTGRTMATDENAPNEATSLGPGLRTVSAASGHRSMFAAGSADRNRFFSSIDTQFPPLLAARRLGGARHVFRAWHRPHNTATRRGDLRHFSADPVRGTAIYHHFRRKRRFHNDFRPETQADLGQGDGPNFGAFRMSTSGRKRAQNTAIYCHFFGVDCGRTAGDQRIRVRTEDGGATVGTSLEAGGGVRSEMRSMSMSTSRIKKTSGQAEGCHPNPDLHLARNPLPNRNLTPKLNLALAFCETFLVRENAPNEPPSRSAETRKWARRTVPRSEA
jgi:hypothetical protein